MSSPHKTTLDAETLHRYHDGELSAEERARVEAALGPEDRIRLEALEELGAVLRGTAEADSADFDAWSGLRQRLAGETVVSLEARRQRRRRTALWAGLSTVLAAAAMVVVLLQPWRAAEAADDDCEIDSIEATGGDVTVLKLQGAGGERATVVWLHEQE